MSHVIGIDIGTSGIKIGAMNKEGVLEYVSYSPYTLLYPQRGYVEINVNEVWEKTKNLLIEVIQKVRKNGFVDAISLSTFCNASVLIDKKGNALGNGIMYLDQRSNKETEWIKNEIGYEEYKSITKNRLEPGMFSVTTLLWTKVNSQDQYARAHKWGNLSTFILNKLTGKAVMDWTHASFSGIFDLVNYSWSESLCGKIGIDQAILPRVVDPLKIIGETICGCSINGIPVVAGAADTACSTLALGIESNQVFESVGTSNVLTVCTENPNHMDIRFLNRCHIIKNRWLSHGAMSTPGAAINWYYKTFLKENVGKDMLEDFAKKSPIGSNGLFFLPYMQGERSPIWDPDARGVFLGLHLNTTKEDMFRSILEGCSLGLRQIYEIIRSEYGLSFQRFQSIGGGSKNKTWAEIKANILNKTIEIKTIPETGVYGACLIASVAVSYYTSFEHAQNQMKNMTSDIIEPQPEKVQKYNELYNLYCELYPSLKDFFKRANT
ncbi:xylulokinase [Evansella vedderi]|uniref:Xylulokinase n=1 Tax=Evansella vedderi TaxID=38282 RepID=A0ABT9ZSE2_9BACI|nr:FGGY family carbohydrate kinase [Evansella vedderi]MDQ0254146.1 xylulokinase [Evansella vedderi]